MDNEPDSSQDPDYGEDDPMTPREMARAGLGALLDTIDAMDNETHSRFLLALSTRCSRHSVEHFLMKALDR